MVRDKGEQALRLPGAHHRSDVAMKSGNKDASSRRARQPGRRSTTSSRAASYSAEPKPECANKTAALVDRDRDGVAPRGRRLAGGSAAPATRRRWRSRRSSTRRSSTTCTPEEFAKFEFPRIVKEDWPTHLQDQVRDGRPCSTSRRTGRSAVRRSTPSSPENPHGARGRRGRVRRGALLPEHLRRRRHKGDADKKGARQPPRPGQEGRQEGRRPTTSAKLKPKEMTENQKGMVTAFNRYICYIKPAASDNAGAGAARRGEVRARAHVLRGAALGGGGARRSATSR